MTLVSILDTSNRMDFSKFPGDTRAVPSTLAFSKVEAFQLCWRRKTECTALQV